MPATKVSITKRAQRKIRESEETLRKIIEASPDAITINRCSDSRFIAVNSAFIEAHDFTLHEVMHKTPVELGIWTNKSQHTEFLRRLRTDGSVKSMEVALKARQRRVVPFLMSAVLTELGGTPCIVSFARDISELKQAERKIRDSEATLRKIIDTSLDPITINRFPDGRFVAVNNAFLKAIGLNSEEEALRSSPQQLHMWADGEKFKQTLIKLQTSGFVRSEELEIRSKDGHISPYLASAVITKIGGDRCVVAISRDITEIRNAQNELNAARQAALDAGRAKSEFLSSMSHEIRTPMNAILGMAELLSRSPLTEEQRRYVSIMRTNGDALLDLINDILDLAKIESGQLTLESADFDLEELLDKVGELMAIRAHEKGLELAVRAASGVPSRLIGDPLRLRQVLINLLGNAIKFTNKGEISLTVEPVTAGSSQTVGSGQEGSDREIVLRFSVADTGIGIPSDKLSSIFSSFTQADSSTTRKYGGSGLGLAIVKRLVELAGGEISVESAPGKGSCFSFTAKFGVEISSLRRHHQPGVNLSGVRVLVVDDTATNRLIAREMLALEGAEIGEAEAGDQALAELERARAAGRPYQLVLLDCRMPGIDGIEVAKRMKHRYETDRDRVPAVVMLTSDDLPERLVRLGEIGVNAYLVKPVRRSELMNAIARAMRTEGANNAPVAVPPTEKAEVTLPSLRILLADDSAVNRLLVRAYFEGIPIDLDEAENGQIVQDKFKNGKYDLVLMDMRMPIADGYAATRAIRNWEAAQNLGRTPIIALTASALKEEVSRCLEAGCDAHVSKPVKRLTLLNAIREMVNATGNGSKDS
jgi:two-component system sensor histidine kinase/response regulator